MFGPLGPTLIDHSDLYLDNIQDSGTKTRVAILAGKASPPSSRLFGRAVGTWGGVNPISTRAQNAHHITAHPPPFRICRPSYGPEFGESGLQTLH